MHSMSFDDETITIKDVIVYCPENQSSYSWMNPDLNLFNPEQALDIHYGAIWFDYVDPIKENSNIIKATIEVWYKELEINPENFKGVFYVYDDRNYNVLGWFQI